MTSILGISAFYHDSAAALLIDGKIIAAAQEERFTRKKHDSSYPFNSIKYVLDESKLELNQIDQIVFYEKPFLKFERLLETYLAFVPRGLRSFITSIPVWLKEKLFQKNLIISELKKIDESFKDLKKIKFCEHHLSHLASAYYPSPFQKSLILTIDGVGEWATTTIAIGDKNKIDIKKEIFFPHSLGLLYSAITYYLGFKVNSGEYKIMGLAPYGDWKVYFTKLLSIFENSTNKYTINQKYFTWEYSDKIMFNKKLCKLLNLVPRLPEEEITQDHKNLAASLQKLYEYQFLKLVRTAKNITGSNNLFRSCFFSIK